ncbi:unnamed protein product [Nezara viridula]|uniref:Uncharacterized protein n=1 Tax=Nezara viridula TaxID=85310 RepID=A0A9P0EGG8_NEZVI|nr:unnamed protein product [Nezara viridula]
MHWNLKMLLVYPYSSPQCRINNVFTVLEIRYYDFSVHSYPQRVQQVNMQVSIQSLRTSFWRVTPRKLPPIPVTVSAEGSVPERLTTYIMDTGLSRAEAKHKILVSLETKNPVVLPLGLIRDTHEIQMLWYGIPKQEPEMLTLTVALVNSVHHSNGIVMLYSLINIHGLSQPPPGKFT